MSSFKRTTVCGKLFRSAPEHVRLALPEEGEPESPWMPDEITVGQRQIQRMNQTGNTSSEEIPETMNLEQNSMHQPSQEPNPPSNSSNHPEPETSHAHSNPGTDSQPDQEPSNPDNPESLDTMSKENPEEASDEAHTDVAYIVCQDPSDALSLQEDSVHAAGRCEFVVQIPQDIDQGTITTTESWALLATNAKKQRTEVKLSELTTQERAEFEKAKAAEVNNWIQTGTITKFLKDQTPADQILRCRWILTWKPVDNARTHNNVQSNISPSPPNNNLQPITHKPKARLVVLGYLDPQIENIPRDSPTLSKTGRMMTLQTMSRMGFEKIRHQSHFLAGPTTIQPNHGH